MCLEVNRRQEAKKKTKKKNLEPGAALSMLHLILHVFGVFLHSAALIVFQKILWIWLGGDIALI